MCLGKRIISFHSHRQIKKNSLSMNDKDMYHDIRLSLSLSSYYLRFLTREINFIWLFEVFFLISLVTTNNLFQKPNQS